MCNFFVIIFLTFLINNFENVCDSFSWEPWSNLHFTASENEHVIWQMTEI